MRSSPFSEFAPVRWDWPPTVCVCARFTGGSTTRWLPWKRPLNDTTLAEILAEPTRSVPLCPFPNAKSRQQRTK